jgi:PAS domain S-box-containing protein
VAVCDPLTSGARIADRGSDRTLPSSSTLLIGLAALLIVYVVAGKLGLRLAFVHASATAVWPPTGIALAAILLYGYRLWPAIFLGAFLVNVTTAGSIGSSFGIAVGNTLEALLGVWLVRRWANDRDVFTRPSGIFAFATLAGLVSTMVSATVGVTSLTLTGLAAWERAGAIWLTWWLGDMTGALVVAPVLVLWARERSRPTLAEASELLFVLASLVLVGGIVFNGLGPAPLSDHSLEFLCVPPLVYAAFRFGPREAATGIALLAGLAIVGTMAGHGPFARATENESLLLLQAFMVMMTIMTLPLAAVVREHQRSEAERARSAAIVASSSDAIIGKTLDGTITSWNEGAVRLYGYAPPEAIGRPISLIIPPELGDELPKILERLARGERIEHYETVRAAKNGRRIDVSITVSPVRAARGRIIGASSIARDITHRKEIEAATRERDVLRSVASLAAGAAHEINNPLAVVMGQLHLLTAEVDLAGRRRLPEILDAAERIRAIVAHMRHLTRIEMMEGCPDLPPMLDLRRSSAPATGAPGKPPG